MYICSDRMLTCRIKSIRSPAKVGTGCYRFKYQPGSTLEGVGDTPPPPPSTAAQLSFFAQPRMSKHLSLRGGLPLFWWMDWTFSWTSNLSILSFSISYVTGITITQGWDVESVVLSFRL